MPVRLFQSLDWSSEGRSGSLCPDDLYHHRLAIPALANLEAVVVQLLGGAYSVTLCGAYAPPGLLLLWADFSKIRRLGERKLIVTAQSPDLGCGGRRESGFLLDVTWEDESKKRFRESAKQVSRAFQDRPMSPMDTAIYWTEYVVRHKGAPLLHFAGADLSLHQYLLLDVVAVLAVFATNLMQQPPLKAQERLPWSTIVITTETSLETFPKGGRHACSHFTLDSGILDITTLKY
uniref:Uncharacterized protein n=1 Tax=Timema bartmani TaxID=61472 RepID=A0A7R9F3R4_9NEOP|nr:unnamed protein product [Timema bartmani]